MTERADDGEGRPSQREFITAVRPPRLRRPDVLRAGHPPRPDPARAAAGGQADYFKATIARADGRIGTGFIGTPALLPALVKIGEPELAAAVFLQEEVPGWLYQVKTRRDHDLGALGRHPARTARSSTRR